MNQEALIKRMDQAEVKALESLSRYKFEMFGYWSSAWGRYNQLAVEMGIFEKKRPNPFRFLVNAANEEINQE